MLVSSFYYISQLRIVSRYAGILGKTADEEKYGTLAKTVAADFNKHFFNAVRTAPLAVVESTGTALNVACCRRT